MMLYKIEKSFAFTVFGASGDLAKIKIFPALYAMAAQKRFPKEFFIYGFARSEMSHEDFRGEFRESLSGKGEEIDESVLEELLTHVFYYTGQYDDRKSYEGFAEEILKKTGGEKITNITYLAVPPTAFTGIINNLSAIRPSLGEDLRVIIEKPFGNDESTARELFHNVSIHFPAEKVFLLDHYLGKEAVQSILALRYANGILNTLLNGNLIANIQITAAEDLSVANRISYFDQVGIIKDMIQSHLLQMLSLLAMDLPVEQEADSIHREKIAVLSALKYRGYEKAMVIGQHDTYNSIPGVKKDSKTATFAAIRLFIDRQNWYKVPIYIRTGKMLNKKHTYVVVEFKKHRFQRKNSDIHPNRLILELQPNERIHLKLYTKVGGTKDQFHDLTTSESLACFGDDCLPEHGRLLLNVFQNDQSNFLTFEEIIATWKFTDKLLACCENRNVEIHRYKDYSEGPSEQINIPQDDGFEWFDVPLK